MKIFKSEFCKETREWSNEYSGQILQFPVMDIDERLREVENKLLILQPKFEQFDKYPALKIAYEEYKMVEKLILGS